MKTPTVLIAMVWLLCSAPLWAAGGYPQSADRYVNDFAGVLTDAQAADIRARFSDLNTSYGIQAVVVTLRSTRDYSGVPGDFDTFVRGLFDDWGIGDPVRNNGALLLVGLEDRKTRIELGAGYRHRHDSEMRTIVDKVLLPKFRNRQFGEGIVAATRSLSTTLEIDALDRGTAGANAADRTDRTDRTDATDAASANGAANVGVVATPTEVLLAEAPLPAGAANNAAQSPGTTAGAANPAEGNAAGSAPGNAMSAEPRNADDPAQGNTANPARGSAAAGDGPPVSPPPATVYYHSSRSMSARALTLIPVLVVGFLFVAVLAGGIALARRLGKRKCPSCQVDMVLLDEVSDDMYLNSGQQLEEALGSINYAVYRCPACGMHSIEPQRRWFSKYSDCPGCGLRALESDRKTLSHPTEYSTGSQLITRRCRNCNHFDEDVVILPRLEPARHSGSHGHGGIHDHGGISHGVGISFGSGSSHSGGSSHGGSSSHGGGSSSSRHFGGGRSGGGGASGSW